MPNDPTDAPEWHGQRLIRLPTGVPPFHIEPGAPPVKGVTAHDIEAGVTLLPDTEFDFGVTLLPDTEHTAW